MAQTLIEKIAQKFAVGLSRKRRFIPGTTSAFPRRNVMTHDNTGAVIPKFRSIKAEKLANPSQVVITSIITFRIKAKKILKNTGK